MPRLSLGNVYSKLDVIFLNFLTLIISQLSIEKNKTKFINILKRCFKNFCLIHDRIPVFAEALAIKIRPYRQTFEIH